MDPLTTSALISTGGQLLGGLFSKEKKGPSVQEQVNANALNQQTIDRNRPSWLVEGAKAAGIHPLVALGMQPVSSGAITMPSGGSGPDWGSIASSAGQGIGRAVEAQATAEDRVTNKLLTALQLKRASLENDLLASQIRTSEAALPPSFPNNVGPHGNVVVNPDEITAGLHGYEAGVPSAQQRLKFNDKDTIRAMSSELANAGLDEGPANWWYQLTRTLPDMIRADVKHAGRRIKRAFDTNRANGAYGKNWYKHSSERR